jgi:cellulose synthase/poly-beta-1,6-N-acetylglucosamine synthase-like glycosyltransferase
MNNKPVMKLGEILVAQGLVTEAHISIALSVQKYFPIHIGEILKYCGWISENDFLKAYSIQKNIGFFHFSQYNLEPSDDSELQNILQNRYMISRDQNGNIFFLLEELILPLIMRLRMTEPQTGILLISKRNFSQLIQIHFSDSLLDNAINLVSDLSPEASAKSIKRYKLFGYFIFIVIVLSQVKLIFFFHSLVNILFSIVQTNFKFLLMIGSFLAYKKQKQIYVSDINLPIYTIMIPLYKEASKAPEVIKNISAIDYPKHKLDIKIIIEEDDFETRRAFSLLEMPYYFELVIVPPSQPRTKPKAMNYAMPLVRGKYLAVYDAEDAPEIDQLRKAVSAFEALPEEYVCLQSRLQFINYNENLLTRFFAIEYNVWFRHLLKGLDYFKVPIPLGGTSNHFKVNILRELMAWDPYNVTEDADLGIRIGICGYKSKMLDSATNEECLTDLKAWIFQRSRWIKGFIISYMIYIKNRPNNSVKNDLATHFFIFLPTYNFVVFPWLLCFGLYYYDVKWLQEAFDMAMIQSLAFNYFAATWVLWRDYKNGIQIKFDDFKAIFYWPFYFLLHTIASYIALWELLRDPFKWNKTTHGTSKL